MKWNEIGKCDLLLKLKFESVNRKEVIVQFFRNSILCCKICLSSLLYFIPIFLLSPYALVYIKLLIKGDTISDEDMKHYESLNVGVKYGPVRFSLMRDDKFATCLNLRVAIDSLVVLC